MKPSEALSLHRKAICRIILENDAANPRVFGSAAQGGDVDGSDLDILVDPVEGKTTLLSLIKIRKEIQALTGVDTDVLTPGALHASLRRAILAKAKQL